MNRKLLEAARAGALTADVWLPSVCRSSRQSFDWSIVASQTRAFCMHAETAPEDLQKRRGRAADQKNESLENTLYHFSRRTERFVRSPCNKSRSVTLVSSRVQPKVHNQNGKAAVPPGLLTVSALALSPRTCTRTAALGRCARRPWRRW